MIQRTLLSFADIAASNRKINSEFFTQINSILDWGKIENEIRKFYKKGMSVDGRPSYSGLLLFKISLLQTWYGLSDYEVEDCVNDRISFSQFVGISMDDKCPDHSVISRFRSELTKKGGYEPLLRMINSQLEKHEVIVKGGAIVDASITETSRKPRGKKEYEVIGLEMTEEKVDNMNHPKVIEKIQAHVDTEAKWVKKGNKLHYGYKKHVVTDNQGLILGVLTTAANVQEISNLEEVLATCQLQQGTKVKADKGYKSKANDEILRKLKLKNQIMFKAKKKQPLTESQKKFNRLVGKVRYKIERTFGSIKRWFQSQKARYVGIAKTHSQHLLESIAYNLYRSPGIMMSSR